MCSILKKNGRWFNLNRKTDGSFKTPNEINKILTKRNLSQMGVIKNLDLTVPTEREVSKMSADELMTTLNAIRSNLEHLPPTRELLGLDKALQRIDGEHLNSSAKLTELEQDIGRQHKKLKEPSLTEDQRKRIENRLKSLKDEYDVRLETLSQSEKALSSQFARIRRTIDKIADKDRSLKERLSILWREQGITLVSVLTAIGMTISTLVLALLPGGGSGGSGGSGKNPHKVRDWVKKSLTSLARLFGKVAKWALSALPGALGSIISWIFNMLKTVVSKVAEHAYAAIGFGAAVISYYLFKK